mmetsp:Transcript_17098/g.24711  ORF Transcript_17098/g.24711 Transcript_17098/m.24711 type:complete len:241 (-) Transcript_17098:249-971(-)
MKPSTAAAPKKRSRTTNIRTKNRSNVTKKRKTASKQQPQRKHQILSEKQEEVIQDVFSQFLNNEKNKKGNSNNRKDDHDDNADSLSLSDAKKALERLGIVDMKKEEIRSWTVSATTVAVPAKTRTMKTPHATRKSGDDGAGNEHNKSTHPPIINRTDFVRMATSKLIQKQKAEKAFALFDRDGKGVIVLEDLQRVVQELDEKDMTTQDLEEMVSMAVPHEGEDGLILFADFCRIVRKINL